MFLISRREEFRSCVLGGILFNRIQIFKKKMIIRQHRRAGKIKGHGKGKESFISESVWSPLLRVQSTISICYEACIETIHLLHVSTWTAKWQWVLLKVRVSTILKAALLLSQTASGTLTDKIIYFRHNSLCHTCDLYLISCNPTPVYLRNHPMSSWNSSATSGDVISEATKIAHMAIITTLKCDSPLRRPYPHLGGSHPFPKHPYF